MPTPVIRDASGTRMRTIILGVMGVAGIGIMLGGYFFEWGFCGYTPGFIALVAGFGGAISMNATGGTWKAACPSCGSELKWEAGDAAFNQAKLKCCGECGTWVHGTDSLSPVEPGYVHSEPVFTAPVGDTFQWPEGCPVCGQPTTRTIKVEGRSGLGSAAVMVAGAGVQRVSVYQVPACAEHDDGVWASRDGEHGDELWFRSFDYHQAFRELNPPQV